ncbi:MBL fold metallo-hydrolase [Streptomyces sp. HNM0574]|uniref:MBL fold metallo-hydrolase n=1 Tax=Streptomyces sp. HNM0574 TaxID=2714954 RepID=UPI00146EA1F9|nr:MBL fold metallo-hydrolase [Streptomyces sp. HNM0574]NLU65982.1 MBL fold metallo-hydrolase [Streptomyces sp. HNM0574]
MDLIKKGHSCVRLEKDGRALVVDPGNFTEADAAVGADAILVTHEHPDHFDEGRLRSAMEANPAARIWTLPSVAERISTAFPGRVTTVREGDAFEAAGFDVQVQGQLHAVIHPDIPQIGNVGYVIGDGAHTVFHPGDALTVPDTGGETLGTLLLPVHAPWNKISEVIDYVREVAPRQALDIHDGLLQDRARPIYDRQIGDLGGVAHGRLAAGERVGLAR